MIDGGISIAESAIAANKGDMYVGLSTAVGTFFNAAVGRTLVATGAYTKAFEERTAYLYDKAMSGLTMALINTAPEREKKP